MNMNMKRLITLLTIATLSNVAVAEETSWFDSLKNSIGLGSETKEEAVKNEAQKMAELPTKATEASIEVPAALNTDGLVEHKKLLPVTFGDLKLNVFGKEKVPKDDKKYKVVMTQ